MRWFEQDTSNARRIITQLHRPAKSKLTRMRFVFTAPVCSCRTYGSYLFPGKEAGAPWNKVNVTVETTCGGLKAAAGAHARSADFFAPFSPGRRLCGESFSPEGGIFLPFFRAAPAAEDHQCTTQREVQCHEKSVQNDPRGRAAPRKRKDGSVLNWTSKNGQ